MSDRCANCRVLEQEVRRLKSLVDETRVRANQRRDWHKRYMREWRKRK
jgi:hypothetical protein